MTIIEHDNDKNERVKSIEPHYFKCPSCLCEWISDATDDLYLLSEKEPMPVTDTSSRLMCRVIYYVAMDCPKCNRSHVRGLYLDQYTLKLKGLV